jgi:hypothetical protein
MRRYRAYARYWRALVPIGNAAIIIAALKKAQWSVSRFARNTVDSLTTIRKLKENGVECYFEKEYIRTGGNP